MISWVRSSTLRNRTAGDGGVGDRDANTALGGELPFQTKEGSDLVHLVRATSRSHPPQRRGPHRRTQRRGILDVACVVASVRSMRSTTGQRRVLHGAVDDRREVPHARRIDANDRTGRRQRVRPRLAQIVVQRRQGGADPIAERPKIASPRTIHGLRITRSSAAATRASMLRSFQIGPPCTGPTTGRSVICQ